MQKLQIPSEEVFFSLMMKITLSRGNIPALVQSFIFIMVEAIDHLPVGYLFIFCL